MDSETLLKHICTALGAIAAPRYFESERGFQGALQTELNKVLPKHQLPTGTIVEQEYQKRLMHHGLKIRPDIIIHEPFEEGRHASRREGNIAVIELKRRADAEGATGDFKSLVGMLDALDYPLGIFLNIDAAETFHELVPQEAKGRIACIAVWQDGDTTQVIRG